MVLKFWLWKRRIKFCGKLESIRVRLSFYENIVVGGKNIGTHNIQRNGTIILML